MTAYINSSFKNLRPSATEEIFNWVDVKRSKSIQIYVKWEKTTLILKVSLERNFHRNYRPITCLRIVWEILIVRRSIPRYYAMDYFPRTEMMLREDKWNRGFTVLWPANYQREQNEAENVAMVGIDYKKEYDMVPLT